MIPPDFRIDGHPLAWIWAVTIEDGSVLLEDVSRLPVARYRTGHIIPAPGLLMRTLTADDTAWDEGQP